MKEIEIQKIYYKTNKNNLIKLGYISSIAGVLFRWDRGSGLKS